MKQHEIMFVEMWREFSLDGSLASDDANKASRACPGRRDAILGGPADPDVPGLIETCTRPDGWDWHITPSGADLVASYEAALVLGLDIVADDAPKTSGRIDCDPDGRERAGRYDDCAFCVGDACNRCGWDLRMGTPRGCDCDVIDRHEPRRAAREPDLVDCPDCDDGTIGIPVAYAANGGVLRVWPATCQRCKGAGKIEDDRARPTPIVRDGVCVLPFDDLLDLAQNEVRAEAVRARDLEWRQLTGDLARELVGKAFEVQYMSVGAREARATKFEGCDLLRLECGDVLRTDGRWWVRGVGP